MSFYIAAVDNLLRTEVEQPTIGLILCKSRDKTTVEYALQYTQPPIGVATYRLSQALPEALQANLPTIEQLEMELRTALSVVESVESENDDDPLGES